MRKKSKNTAHTATLQFTAEQMRKLSRVANRYSLTVKQLVQKIINAIFPA
jgi:hypothetical protein